MLLRIVAHAQFCMSGDTTIDAAESLIAAVVNEDADDYFVFVVSDANLQRYGIEPHELGSVLISDDRVAAYAVFIASFGDEAARIKAELPVGKGIVCFDSSSCLVSFARPSPRDCSCLIELCLSNILVVY